jgi:dTDP-glucose pyrophosphorylase
MNSKKLIKAKDLFIQIDASMLDALRQMDKYDKKLLIVFNGDKFINILSIGDIQRAIINNLPLDLQINSILRKNPRLCFNYEPFNLIKQKMLEYRTECMPILDENYELVDVYFWEDVFLTDEKRAYPKLNLPVVIMAGGQGIRLKPLTNILPKPLIPFNEKTIIENIIDRFMDVGCNNFIISVNYKAEMIKYYFESLNNKEFEIEYIQEEKPLGTAGSLFLLKGKITSTFFISNCDIIINENYGEIFQYHKENKNELTIVAALKHFQLDYGILHTKENGLLTSINEKPELIFKINSGMYLLEPHLLDEIPENKFFHITELIEKINKRNGKVGVFPVTEKSWIDIGNLSDFFNIMKK